MPSEEKHTTPLDLARNFLIIAGVLSVLGTGATWAYQVITMLATKDYHDATLQTAIQEAVAPIQKSMEATQKSFEEVESGVSVPRIQNIMNLKCATNGNIPQDVEDILQRLLARYKEIEKRDFDEGRCHEGKRITTYEARQLGLIN